jgi:hypothetical protein
MILFYFFDSWEDSPKEKKGKSDIFGEALAANSVIVRI